MAEELSLGENIKRYRKNKKLTQAQLGRLLGKSASTIYGYESNQILPSYDTVCRISSILSVDFDKLVNLKEPIYGSWKEQEKYEKFVMKRQERNHENEGSL